MNMILNTRVKCSDCPIRHQAVCAKCNDDELAILEQMKVYRSFKAEPICWRSVEFGYVASVVFGVASLGKTLEDGRTQMLGLLLPSDFIGRPGRDQIEFDVTAVTDVTLCCFERKPFEHLIETTPHIAQRLMEIALDELDAARDWMLLLGRKTAREKVASFVEMLVRRQEIDGMDVLHALPLTREEVANYLGLTLETVSRQLSALKSDGVLAFQDRKHFNVLNRNALIRATGDEDSA